MRQPHARRTGREALDRCYVVCWNTGVGEAVKLVKDGLEAEGADGPRRRGRRRRAAAFAGSRWRGASASGGDDIFLPLVLHRHERGWRELDYWRHIVPEIDWAGLRRAGPARQPGPEGVDAIGGRRYRRRASGLRRGPRNRDRQDRAPVMVRPPPVGDRSQCVAGGAHRRGAAGEPARGPGSPTTRSTAAGRFSRTSCASMSARRWKSRPSASSPANSRRRKSAST